MCTSIVATLSSSIINSVWATCTMNFSSPKTPFLFQRLPFEEGGSPIYQCIHLFIEPICKLWLAQTLVMDSCF